MRISKTLAIATAFAATTLAAQSAQKESEHSVFVDSQGVMRWKDSNKEANFFGTNYTVPFAYAYRALERKGIDHKKAIEGDVYHMARLGLNAMRLHLWDVEIADSQGNLIDNVHLDLLDYLVSECEKRDISVILTLQTNFGNGYPERNADTGGYSYKYDKCDVHSNAQAIEAQQRYATQFLQHVNRYTGKKYGEDACIVGFEINNEPCHVGSPDKTLEYINTMYDTMREAGCTRPIFYNASHNADHRKAYFASKVEGNTYQWYPSGLVAGHARKGNFLPAIDVYSVPFDTIDGFSTKAKIIYEFDPADLTTSYQYPVTARAFRAAGFQWITQFAYDPTDIAAHNSEYQTHYMNLAYTPQKAISLAIAAQVARENNRLKQRASYPTDTIFENTTVSYVNNLSVYNNGTRFIYTNSNDAAPTSPKSLEHVAGVGNSRIVSYSGTGAYFLDRLEKGVWRLEVMPDAVSVADAYEKPSESRVVTETAWNANKMSIALPDLGDEILMTLIGGEETAAQASDLTVEPGVYLLKAKSVKAKNEWNAESVFDGNKRVGEFVAPKKHEIELCVRHEAPKCAIRNRAIELECTVAGEVDSVVVFPRWISFWKEKNESVALSRESNFVFKGEIPTRWTNARELGYFIVAYSKDEVRTYPSGESGMPLDWDSRISETFNVRLVSEGEPLVLCNDASQDSEVEIYSTPHYRGAWTETMNNMPFASNSLRCHFAPNGEKLRYFVRKFVGDIAIQLNEILVNKSTLKIGLAGVSNLESVNVTLISKHGISYSKRVALSPDAETVSVNVSELQQSPTALLPIGYPDYLPSFFSTTESVPFSVEDIEFVEISTDEISSEAWLDLRGIWLED